MRVGFGSPWLETDHHGPAGINGGCPIGGERQGTIGRQAPNAVPVQRVALLGDGDGAGSGLLLGAEDETVARWQPARNKPLRADPEERRRHLE